MILPTGMVPAEGGHFVVEFDKSDGVFRIRDTSTLEVAADITMPADVANSWPPKFCYDAETLTFLCCR